LKTTYYNLLEFRYENQTIFFAYILNFKIQVFFDHIEKPFPYNTQAIFGEAMCRDLAHKGFAATAGMPVVMLRMAVKPL
jgi:hypothetical protein